MSLLLDALKKAAKDKQNASSQGETADSGRVQDKADQGDDALHLTLDDDSATDAPEAEQPDKTIYQAQDSKADELTMESEQARTTTSTVSDEALQMLVYKTNREHRRRQKMVWSAVASVSVFILLLGGYYFYDNMVKDIESLERKHRIAIQKVNAEVIKKKRPELIADLTDNATVGNTPAKQEAAHKPSVAKSSAPAAASDASRKNTGKPAKSKTASPQFVRTTKVDPVADMLQQGWRAYNRADYATASTSYREVLQREPENRDALLGMAAIAMKRNRIDEAKSHYAKLLKLNPRDPIAVAALANLKQAAVSQGSHSGQQFSELSESRLKMLLKQQPDSAPVNFALGNISAQQKKWPQAQSYYFNAWMADDGNPDYAFNLAVSLDRIGKPDQAARFYHRSLELARSQNHSFSTDAVKLRLQSLERQP